MPSVSSKFFTLFLPTLRKPYLLKTNEPLTAVSDSSILHTLKNYKEFTIANLNQKIYLTCVSFNNPIFAPTKAVPNSSTHLTHSRSALCTIRQQTYKLPFIICPIIRPIAIHEANAVIITSQANQAKSKPLMSEPLLQSCYKCFS